MAVGFVDFNELRFGLSVAWVSTRVVFDGELTVSTLDISETGISGHSEYLIVCRSAGGIVLLEEGLLMLILDSVLVKEPVKKFVCVMHAETLIFDFVVVLTLGNIREGSIGFVNVVESALGVDSIVRMLFGMPLGCKSLVGSFDVLLTALLVEAECVIEIFLRGYVSYSYWISRAAGVGRRGVGSATGPGS